MGLYCMKSTEVKLTLKEYEAVAAKTAVGGPVTKARPRKMGVSQKQPGFECLQAREREG